MKTMSSQNLQNDDNLIETIIEKLKKALDLKNDTDVAKALATAQWSDGEITTTVK